MIGYIHFLPEDKILVLSKLKELHRQQFHCGFTG